MKLMVRLLLTSTPMWSNYKTPRANHSLNSIPWYHRRASREVALLPRHFVRCVVCSGKSKCVLCARAVNCSFPSRVPCVLRRALLRSCARAHLLLGDMAGAGKTPEEEAYERKQEYKAYLHKHGMNTYGFCLEWWWWSSSSTSCVSVSWKA